MSKIAGKVIYPVQFNRKVKGTCKRMDSQRWTVEYAEKKQASKAISWILWGFSAIAVSILSFVISGGW